MMVPESAAGSRSHLKENGWGLDADTVRFFGVQSQFLNGASHGLLRDFTLLAQRVERPHGRTNSINLEEPSQNAPGLTAPKTVTAKAKQAAWNPWSNLIRDQLQIVGDRNPRAILTGDHCLQITDFGCFGGMEHVPSPGRLGFAPQTLKAGGTPDVH